MVGFQSFPTNFKDINIEKINVLKRLYPNVKIGYADHTVYNDDDMVKNNIYAYKLGARVFEKHISIEEGVERIDYISAINQEKFSKLVWALTNNIEITDTYANVDLNYLSGSEITYRNREKFAVASNFLKKGDFINQKEIKYKLIDSGVGFASNDIIPKKRINRDILEDDLILKTDFADY